MGEKADDIKGRAKEAVGDLTDAASSIKEKVEEVTDKVRDR